MTQKIAQLIRYVAWDESMHDVGFRNNYSGRGMYGRQCVGITGSEEECQKALATMIKEARYQEDNLDFEDAVDALMCFKRDSMGHDVIIYWPNIEALAERAADDDGQPDEFQEWRDFDPDC